jgi:hypothetical protein
MPYQKKASAPAIITFSEAIAAGILGTDAAWLAPWLPFMPPQNVDVDALCANGPMTDVPTLSAGDFVMTPPGRNPLAWIALANGLNQLSGKLADVLTDRMFGAYCETVPTSAPGWSEIWSTNWSGTTPSGANVFSTPFGNGTYRLHWYRTLGDNQTYFAADTWPPTGGALFVRVGGPVGTGGLHDEIWDSWTGNLNSLHWAGGQGASGGAAYGRIAIEQYVPTGTSYPYAPVPQSQPSGVHAPPAGTYGTIADLGAELDKLEFKLDMLSGTSHYIANALPAGPGTPDAPQSIARTDKPATGTAIGVVITVASVPAAVSIISENPTFYRDLGHATLWTADGPLPPIAMNYNPMVIMFGSVGVTNITVSVMAPATATYALLQPPK